MNEWLEDSMEAKRGNERHAYDRPDFVYVKFRVDKASEKENVRVLNVADSSKTGLALLITQKDADLLRILEKGDRLRDMTFFGLGIRIKEDGTVRHMSKIREGKYKGSYLLGVEAPDIGAGGSLSEGAL
ncbi:MAG: hypothetical protein V1758_07605 [Pseudomonadota bacterium]